jgi:hypothetical protein
LVSNLSFDLSLSWAFPPSISQSHSWSLSITDTRTPPSLLNSPMSLAPTHSGPEKRTHVLSVSPAPSFRVCCPSSRPSLFCGSPGWVGHFDRLAPTRSHRPIFLCQHLIANERTNLPTYPPTPNPQPPAPNPLTALLWRQVEQFDYGGRGLAPRRDRTGVHFRIGQRVRAPGPEGDARAEADAVVVAWDREPRGAAAFLRVAPPVCGVPQPRGAGRNN